MAQELVRGQNHPLPHNRLEIRVTAAIPVIACAVLGDAEGTVPGTAWLAHPGSPRAPGVEVSQGPPAGPRFHVDLEALPERAHLVRLLLALPEGIDGPATFGATAAPHAAVASAEGAETASFTLTGLDSESAVVALELYRRHGAWKVRAVGQGYADGLARLLGDQGLPDAATVAAAIQDMAALRTASAIPRQGRGDRDSGVDQDSAAQGPAAADTTRSDGGGRPASGRVDYTHPGRRRRPSRRVPEPERPERPERAPEPGQPLEPAALSAGIRDGGAGLPVAGDATGWSMDERLYNQVWGMFEDLARTVAAYRGATDFAESRMERELESSLSDPRARTGAAADSARFAARAKHDRLVRQARTALDRDLAQLTRESEVVEPALPFAYARWDSPRWDAYRAPAQAPMAARFGDLCLPERMGLRIPLLLRLPLERGLWLDSGRTGSRTALMKESGELRRLAMDAAVLHAARLLASHPAGEFTVRVIDPAGSAAPALAPLVSSGALDEPPAAGAAGVAAVLAALTRRVDLVQMAVRAGASGALPPDLDLAEQLLVVNDFPHGFDDRAVTQLRYLADEGPEVGVHLLMVADREDAGGYGPVLDPMWRSLLRLTPVAADHLADPWVGHAWIYEPPKAPGDAAVLPRLLGRVTRARRDARRSAHG